MALVDDQPRMASALATMGTTVIIVSREVLTTNFVKRTRLYAAS